MLEDNECISIAGMVLPSQPWLAASGNNIIGNNIEDIVPVALMQFVSACHWTQISIWVT